MVDPLQHQLLRPRPFEAGDVVLARIIGHLQPCGGTALRAHHAGGDGGVRGAGLGVLDGCDERVERVGVVREQEPAHAGHVEVPVGDAGAVRGPAEAVAQVELLFVDPIRHAVHVQRVGAGGETRDAAVGEALDVQIALPHVRDAVARGREFGVHERRPRGVATQLLERPAGAVQHPVVPARVLAPHPLCVGEDEELRCVARPVVVVDVEGCSGAPGDELPRGDGDAARARRRLVAHDVRSGVVGRRLDGGVGRPAGDPARRTEVLRRELAGGEEAPQHVRSLGRNLCREGRSHESARRDGDAHRSTHHTVTRARVARGSRCRDSVRDGRDPAAAAAAGRRAAHSGRAGRVPSSR